MAFSVPSRVRPFLMKLATIDDATFSAAITLLGQMPVLINPADVATFSSEHANEAPSDVFRDAVQAGISLAFGRSSTELDTPAFVEQVLQSLEESSDFRTAGIDVEKLRTRLCDILSIPSLSVAAKAANIALDTARHMTGGRILTDIRPVFGAKIGSPTACLILHNLKIEYHEGDEDNRNFFTSLDVADLKTLRDAVDRALEKEKRLRTMLAATGVSVVGLAREPVEVEG
jgi:hypothetical protein